MFAYAILILIFIASGHSPYLKTALQNWRLWITRGMHASIILVFMVKESFQYINWWWMLAFVAVCAFFACNVVGP